MIKKIIEGVKNKALKIYIMLVLCVLVNVVIYYAIASDINTINKDSNLFTVDNETDGYIFESSYFVHRHIKKGVEGTETELVVYNKDAGNIDNWNTGIYLNEYEMYSKSLVKVNGSAVNTDIHEDYMDVTFSNDKILKVLFERTATPKEYSLSYDGVELLETNTILNTQYENIYTNGVVQVIYKTEASPDVVIGHYLDKKEFILCVIKLGAMFLILDLLLIPINKIKDKIDNNIEKYRTSDK